MKHRLPSVVRLALPATPLAVAFGLLQVSTAAQDRLKTMPGYQQYQKMVQAIPGAVRLGSVGVNWSPDGKSFDNFNDGKRYRFDVAHTRTATETGIAEAPTGRGGRGAGRGAAGAPERGRQFDSAPSPDGRQKAFYRDRNLWVSDASGGSEVAVTTDGERKGSNQDGTASWVYGEELGQRTAMWWSPDSRRLAYYRFDEKQVPDHHLQVDQDADSEQGRRRRCTRRLANPSTSICRRRCRVEDIKWTLKRDGLRQRRRRPLRLTGPAW